MRRDMAKSALKKTNSRAFDNINHEAGNLKDVIEQEPNHKHHQKHKARLNQLHNDKEIMIESVVPPKNEIIESLKDQGEEMADTMQHMNVNEANDFVNEISNLIEEYRESDNPAEKH